MREAHVLAAFSADLFPTWLEMYLSAGMSAAVPPPNKIHHFALFRLMCKGLVKMVAWSCKMLRGRSGQWRRVPCRSGSAGRAISLRRARVAGESWSVGLEAAGAFTVEPVV